MTEDEILAELKIELQNTIPAKEAIENQEIINALEKVLLDFILPFQKEEIIVYMQSREEGKSHAQHISEVPNGVRHFEEWFNNGLVTFASNILNSLKLILAKDKIYLTFAQLLDSKNLETFFESSKFKEEDKSKFSAMFAPLFSNSELDIFLQALSCMSVGLDNSAKSLLKVWIQALWFDGGDMQKIIDEAKVIEGIKLHSSKAGKLGAKERRRASNETKKFAIELMLNGTFKNPTQATSAISNKVIDYGRTVGFNFSCDFQAPKTIYNWLRTHLKDENITL